ncbi:diphosphoinositol polyphosphate phosphohydrolase 1 [Crotalus adamanteus]|uniref:diphosphoinositol-polyphosphate diphosphatase n=1 Tax=Crotalus adamanteus TaxID=8729 RepID=A0AAW1BR32_CROAD
MMKLKSNQTRTYDGDGYKKRAACLCFRNESEEEVLLVSSSRHPDRWIVPGGGMEPEEEPSVAAVREVCEEAGVKGTLGRLVGIFENQDRKHRTYVYVLIVTEVLEDWEDSVNIGRKREWFKIDDAIKVLQYHKPVEIALCSPDDQSRVTWRNLVWDWLLLFPSNVRGSHAPFGFCRCLKAREARELQKREGACVCLQQPNVSPEELRGGREVRTGPVKSKWRSERVSGEMAGSSRRDFREEDECCGGVFIDGDAVVNLGMPKRWTSQ